jgi:hypothetical protein
MRNRRSTIVGLVLVLSLASMSFKCNSNTEPSGNTNPLRSSARAADAIAKSVSEMTTVKRELASQGKISAAEELKLTQQLLRVNSADKVLVNRLKSMNSTPDATGQAQLLSLFNELTAAINDLNSTGVLSVGDEAARNRLTVIITAINSSLAIIQSFVGTH